MPDLPRQEWRNEISSCEPSNRLTVEFIHAVHTTALQESLRNRKPTCNTIFVTVTLASLVLISSLLITVLSWFSHILRHKEAQGIMLEGNLLGKRGSGRQVITCIKRTRRDESMMAFFFGDKVNDRRQTPVERNYEILQYQP